MNYFARVLFFVTLPLAVALALVLPDLALAQNPLAPSCSGTECSSCHLVELANNLIKWLIGIVTVLFAVLLAVSGFGLVTSGGNPAALESAKKHFTNAIIGFLIILSAWLLVDTLMRGLVGNNGNIRGYGPWSRVECWDQTASRLEAGFVERAYDTVTSAPVACGLGPMGSTECASQVASCQADGGTANVDDSSAGNHFVLCERPIGVADPGTVRAVCDEGPSGERVLCTAQIAACNAEGGTPAINSSDPARHEVACAPNSPTGACKANEMTRVRLFGFRPTVHNSIAGKLQSVNAAWEARGGQSFYRVYSVGGYNCRRITGGSGYSVHAYGLAVDINPRDNPYTRRRPCPTNMPSSFVSIFTGRGFGWGGNWRSVCDAMHFSDAAREGGSQRI